MEKRGHLAKFCFAYVKMTSEDKNAERSSITKGCLLLVRYRVPAGCNHLQSAKWLLPNSKANQDFQYQPLDI